jgi:hypothetical protein
MARQLVFNGISNTGNSLGDLLLTERFIPAFGFFFYRLLLFSPSWLRLRPLLQKAKRKTSGALKLSTLALPSVPMALMAPTPTHLSQATLLRILVWQPDILPQPFLSIAEHHTRSTDHAYDDSTNTAGHFIINQLTL